MCVHTIKRNNLKNYTNHVLINTKVNPDGVLKNLQVIHKKIMKEKKKDKKRQQIIKLEKNP